MSARQIAYIGILAALYIIIGRFTQFIPNPMVGGGSSIALNMVVVVIAGILFGPIPGLLVGLIGTGLNAMLTSTGSRAFELAAIIPHMIMGLSAGAARRAPVVLAALTIIVGHVLNLSAFVIAGLMPLTQATALVFSVGLLAETVVDVAVISIAVPLLRPLVKQPTPA